MRMIIGDTYEDMSRLAMQHLLGHMFQQQGRVNLSITGGTTPIRMYGMLAPEMAGKGYFNHVHFYNFDEIPHKVKQQEGITMTDLRKLFYGPAGIPEGQIHILNEQTYGGYDAMIERDGGLDAMLLGVGWDGHFCGNLPNTTRFSDRTVMVPCDAVVKGKIRKYFEEEEDVPDTYLTMGPASVMAARHLILIASGVKKQEVMKKFVYGDVDAMVPVSILKMHPHVTVIMDKDAAGLL